MAIADHGETSRFARFAAVGSVGFVVDVAVLTLMLALFGGYYSGRLVSFLCAATFTWWGNRRFTFSSSRSSKNLVREWARFLGANSAGAVVNYSVYALAIALVPFTREWPILAVAAGTLSGLCLNFLLSRRFVFTSSALSLGKKEN